MSAYPHFTVYGRYICKVKFVVLRSCCAFTCRALCALCSVGSAGSLAVFFPCIVCSLQGWFCRLSGHVLVHVLLHQLPSAQVPGSRAVLIPFYVGRLLSVTRSTLNLTASGLNFKTAVKSSLALSIARTM